ncbi:MAG: Gfo/Idh/MocA family oxidoreductase [Patescibacteria group bacterium]|nr:Gfo/Idh/MocA family oxidoreductase [Patescibacteria group bacterium]
MKLVKLGIIGIGNHFQEKLLPALMITKGLVVDSVYSSDINKAKKFKDILGAKQIFDNWKKLIDQSDIDALIVTGSPDFHQKIITYCLEKDCFIFVEKPPVKDFRSLKLILEQKEKIKNRIFVGYSFRHSQSYDNLVKILSRESEIVYLNFRYLTNKPKDLLWHCKSVFESYILAIGIHPIEMAINIFKSKPKKIDLFLTRIKERDFVANLALSFISGKNALIEISNCSNKLEMEYKIINRKGEIGILTGFEKFRFYNLKNIELNLTLEDIVRDRYEIIYQVSSTENDYYKNGYGRELELFYKTVIGEIENPSPLEESLLVYYVIDQLIKKYQKLKS